MSYLTGGKHENYKFSWLKGTIFMLKSPIFCDSTLGMCHHKFK